MIEQVAAPVVERPVGRATERIDRYLVEACDDDVVVALGLVAVEIELAGRDAIRDAVPEGVRERVRDGRSLEVDRIDGRGAVQRELDRQ